jgi:ribosome biogenesis GTPase
MTSAEQANQTTAGRPGDRLNGVILRAQSGFFWVSTAIGTIECRLRGKLKRERQSTDLAVIGDEVEISLSGADTGAVEAIHPRRSKLARRAAGSRGAYKEDVLVANVDQVLLVFSCDRPAFAPRMLDRYLVICEYNDLEVLIVATKTDLVGHEAARSLFVDYEQIGYRVAYTSTHTGTGVAELREDLAGRISVVTGKSGVGKSSLLNMVQPDLNLATSDVSELLNKGRHTTTVAELHPFDHPQGGFVADTPGIREIGLWNMPPGDLDWCFREFQPYLDDCYFSGCTHVHEPECAVRTALADGHISAARYDSYVRLRTATE